MKSDTLGFAYIGDVMESNQGISKSNNELFLANLLIQNKELRNELDLAEGRLNELSEEKNALKQKINMISQELKKKEINSMDAGKQLLLKDKLLDVKKVENNQLKIKVEEAKEQLQKIKHAHQSKSSERDYQITKIGDLENQVKSSNDQLKEVSSSLEMLSKELNKYTLSFKVSKQGVLEFDNESRKFTYSESWCYLFGYPGKTHSDDLSTFLSKIHPDDRQDFSTGFERFRRDCSNALRKKIRVRDYVGDYLTITFYAQFLKNNTQGFLISGLGVSSLQEEKGPYQQMLEEAAEEVSKQKIIIANLKSKNSYLNQQNSAVEQLKRQLEEYDFKISNLNQQIVIRNKRIEEIGEELIISKEIMEEKEEELLQLKNMGQPSDQNEILSEKQAEIDLLKAQLQQKNEAYKNYSLIANKTDNAIIITDKNGLIEYVNAGFEKITEYSQEEVIGKKPGDFLQGEETNPDHAKAIREGLKSQESFSQDILNYSKTGKPYWLSISITPIFNEDGELEKFIAVERDITESKQKDRELEEAESALRTLMEEQFVQSEALIKKEKELSEALAKSEEIRIEMENLSMVASKTDNAVIITDAMGAILYVNEGFERITEYTKSEVLGKKPGDFLQGHDTSQAHVEAIREGLKSKKAFSQEILNYSKTGRSYWLKISINPIFDENGNVEKFIAVESDITEQKLKEQDFQNLSLVASKTDNAVIITNQFGQIEWVNNGFEKITEYSLEEVKGKKPGDFLQGPATRREDILAIRQGIKSQQPFKHEIYNYSKSGKGYWISVSITPIFNENGQLDKFIAIESDITEEKQTREEVQKLSLVASRTDNAVIITDQNGMIEWVNEGFTRLTEYDSHEVTGKKPGSILQGEKTNTDDVMAIRRGLKSKKPFKHEIYNYSKSGRGYWLSLSITPLFDEAGEIEKFIAIENDITAQKEAEMELENLSLIASKTDNIVVVADQNGQIEWVNQSFVRLTEYTLEEVKGKKPGSFLQGPETREEDVQAIRQGIKSQKPFRHEIYNYSKSGKGYWISVSITPIFNENGQLDKFIAIESDITEEKQTREEVQKLSLVASRTDNAVIITDQNGMIEWVNEGFTRLTEYDLHEVMGKKPGSILQGEKTSTDDVIAIRRGLKSKKPFKHEIYNYSKSGRGYWLSLSITPLFDQVGEVEKFIAIENDVTAQKEAEMELENLSLVASKTDNIVVVTDQDGYIEWVNQSFVKLTEYKLEEVKGKKPGSFLQGPDTKEEDVLAIRRGIKKQKPFSAEIYNYSKSGNGYWLSLSITPIFDEDGKLSKFIAIESDITESKRLNQEIEESEEQMRVLMEEQFSNQELLLQKEKTLKEALDESKLLSMVVSKTDNAVVVTDKNGFIQFVNEGFEKITEYSAQEVIGKKPGSLLQGKDTNPAHVQAIREGLQSKKPFTQEILNYSKSGKPYWLSLSITPIIGEDGEVEQFIAIESDISEKKSAEEELQNLSLVASKTDNAVIITDKAGNIEWVNSGFEKITDYRLEEVIGKKPGDFLQGEKTDPKHVTAIREGIASEKPFSAEIYNYGKTGRGYWLSLSITPIFDKSGQLEKFIAIESDITETKTLQLEIQETEEHMRKIMDEQFASSEELIKDLNVALEEEKKRKKELDDALARVKQTQSQVVQNEKMASLGQLTAGIAHEINNPINFVYNGIDSLNMSIDDLTKIMHKYGELEQAGPGEVDFILREIGDLKKRLRYEKLMRNLPGVLSDIKSGANRTIEIVKGLRVFSRLDEEDQKAANINECLDSTLILLRNKTKDKIEVRKFFDDSLKEIMCYPGQLNQVFMNLLSNAVQAIPEERKDGKIMIYTENQDENVIIRVMDNGAGMPEDVKKKIFEPFFTTKPVGIGTGLGLSISYGIIEKHAGRIYVNSELGKGTEFVIELPKKNQKVIKSLSK